MSREREGLTTLPKPEVTEPPKAEVTQHPKAEVAELPKEGLTELPDFHLQQYDWLKKEIGSAINEAYALERYAVIGTGAVWAWLATHLSPVLPPKIAWWIPLLFAVFGALRSLALIFTIKPKATYMRKLEDEAFPSQKPLGWERYYEKERRPFVGTTMTVFWLLLIGVTSIFPCYIIQHLYR